MFHWDADAEFETSKDEHIASELEDERAQILEISSGTMNDHGCVPWI